MKKIISITLLSLLLLCGCSGGYSEPIEKKTLKSAANTLGVWISAFELNDMLQSEKGFEKEFSMALDTLEKQGVNCLYVHVRAFADSYYPSSLYPFAAAVSKNIDPLKIMIAAAKQRGMSFFAWINPYRISTASNDRSKVDEKIVKAVGDEGILTTSGGVYLDPASINARRLVIDGVREIIKNYNVDGIHFDDYFYPTKSPDFDEASYKKYKQSATTPLSLEDWRRANVNALISGTYAAIKSVNKNILLSVSPTADIRKNFSTLFADVGAWVKGGYVDEIIPQLYFGFRYPKEEFRFPALIDAWKDYLKDENLRILIGLANYKENTPADFEKQEWSKGDVIPRQIKYVRENMANAGCVYFSYGALKMKGEKYEN